MSGLGMFDPPTQVADRTTIETGSPARTPLRRAWRGLTRGREESPPLSPGDQLLRWGWQLVIVGLLAWTISWIANTVYIANAGPAFALMPTGMVQTFHGWRKIESRIVDIQTGFKAGTYAVVTNDGEVYLANDWDTRPEVLAKIKRIMATSAENQLATTAAPDQKVLGGDAP